MMKQLLIGKISIYHSSCLPLMRKVPNDYYDLAIIDPPYGLSTDMDMFGDSGTRRGKSLAKRGKYNARSWDSKSPSKQYFNELFRISKNQIIFGANHFISKIPFDSPCWIIWDKVNGDNKYADCELAWTSFNCSAKKVKLKWHGFLQQDMKNKEARIHPTQKPVRLYQWIYENFATPDSKIIDTHLGSFSSAIAAHYFGCEFMGIEIDKEYFDTGLKRFKEKTLQNKINFD